MIERIAAIGGTIMTHSGQATAPATAAGQNGGGRSLFWPSFFIALLGAGFLYRHDGRKFFGTDGPNKLVNDATHSDLEQRITKLESQVRVLRLKLDEPPSVPAAHSLAEQASSSSPARDTPDFSVSPSRLVAERRKNLVAFDQKYKNKTLEVSGEVQIINRDGITITDSRTTLVQVDCIFNSVRLKAVASLNQQSRVTVIGRYLGDRGAGICLNDCRLVDAHAREH
jgi:tRNA_anti-like